MSRFETGSLANSGRNVARLPTPGGVEVFLNAPGLAVAPPAIQRSSFADSLMTDLGLIDRATGLVAAGVQKGLAFDASMAAANEHAAREAERIAREHEQALRGAGTQAAQESLPLVLDSIAKSTDLLSDDQIAERAKAIVANQTAGLEGASLSAATDLAVPRVIAALTARREQLQTFARAETKTSIIDSVLNTTDPAAFAKAVSELQNVSPGIPQQTIERDLRAAQLNYQSEYGTPESFNALLDAAGVGSLPTNGLIERGNINLLGRPTVKNADGSISTVRTFSANIDGREVLLPTIAPDGTEMTQADAVARYRASGESLGVFDSPEAATAYAEALHKQQESLYGGKGLVDPTVLGIAKARFAERQAAQDRAIGQSFDNALARGLLDARDGKITLDSVEANVRSKFEGKISDEKLRSGINSIDEVRKSIFAETRKRMDDVIKAGVATQAQSDADSLALSGGVWNIDAAGPDRYVTNLVDGSEYRLPAADIQRAKQRAVDNAAATIDQQYANEPGKAFAGVVDLIARNKMVPSSVAAILNNVDAASIDALVPDRSSRNPVKAEPPPPQLIGAAETYRRMYAINPAAAAIAVKDDHARTLFDTYSFLQTLPEYAQQPAETNDSHSGRLLLAAVEMADRASWHPFGAPASGVDKQVIADSLDQSSAFGRLTRDVASSVTLGAIEPAKYDPSNARNIGYVQGVVEARANFYKHTRNIDDQQAADAAVASFLADHTRLSNGYWVDMRQEGLDRDTLETAMKHIGEEYVRTEKAIYPNAADRQVESADDVALIPTGDGRWSLVTSDGMAPLNRANVPGYARFTTSDLIDIAARVRNAGAPEAATARDKAVNDAVRSQFNRRPSRLNKAIAASHSASLSVLNDRLAAATDPADQARLQNEIDRLNEQLAGVRD